MRAFLSLLAILLLPLAALGQVTVQTLQSDVQALQADQQKLASDLSLFAMSSPRASSVCDQDDVDLTQSVIGGFGGRLATGQYRGITLAVRQYFADHAAKNPNAMANFQAAIGRTTNPGRACKIATIAVIALPIFNSFEPIPDYATILAELEALQAAACGGPTPVPVPVPIPPVPTPAPTQSRPTLLRLR